ncbi:hypothetical protein PR003_g31473 [Phytophthora rubi]|uniref:Uncharacterized protein n=1 Tax=Phytophthora rubi TaxID=129364 RepID=A0A6A4B7G6_9STRA|nr:hypothetical protein PR003_g31473 [Phytophthora rubi]
MEREAYNLVDDYRAHRDDYRERMNHPPRLFLIMRASQEVASRRLHWSVIVDNTNLRVHELKRYLDLQIRSDKLAVASFECPRGPVEATILLGRAIAVGHDIPGHIDASVQAAL